MKPKTKLQNEVVKLSAKLPRITGKQIQWAINNGFKNYANYLKGKNELTCFTCGHKWKNNDSSLSLSICGCICPNCRNELKVKTDKKQSLKESFYYGIIDTNSGFQLFRIFIIERSCKLGESACYSCHEVIQHWIQNNGKKTTMALSRNITPYIDSWTYGSELEIRQFRPSAYGYSNPYNIDPYKLYPRKKIIPEVKRNGFTGSFYKCTPDKLFSKILSNPKAETLLKAGQYNLLNFLVYGGLTYVETHWQSIKICIRNKYIVGSASIWFDHLNCLEYFHKDILNPKYICPENLIIEHNKLCEKKRKIEDMRITENRRKQLEDAEKRYKEEKERYFGLQFSDGLIQVVVLKSVNEIKLEGEKLHHCVFGSGYYKKSESLLLSARIEEDKPLETIEVSLKEMDIIQSRGVANGSSPYHKRIIQLVRNNINLIQKAAI